MQSVLAHFLPPYSPARALGPLVQGLGKQLLDLAHLDLHITQLSSRLLRHDQRQQRGCIGSWAAGWSAARPWSTVEDVLMRQISPLSVAARERAVHAVVLPHVIL